MDQPSVADEVFEQGQQIVKSTATSVQNAPQNLAKAAMGQVAPGAMGESSPDNSNALKPPAKSLTHLLRQQLLKKSPEDQAKEDQKLTKLRQELHSAYYQRLVNPPKAPEEKPAERVEKQEQVEERQKFAEAQKKQKDNAGIQNTRDAEHQKGIGG